MNKRSSIKYRIASFILSVLMLINILTTPTGIIASELADMMLTEEKPPTSLDDIKIPSVTKNPYDVEVSVKTYPVLNSHAYDFLKIGHVNSISDYKIHPYKLDGYSSYYTSSITPWFDYEFWIDRKDDMQITSELPFREGRESIFTYQSGTSSSPINSTVTLKNGGITVRPINDLSNLSNSRAFKEILAGYLTEQIGLNIDQVNLRAEALLLSGNGRIDINMGDGGNNFYVYDSVRGDEGSKLLSVDAPMSQSTLWTTIYYDADNGIGTGDNIMTDFALTLIDDTAPSVRHISVTRDVRDDYSADLVLNMTFNEAIRFADESASSDLDNIWVELELYDLLNEEKSTVRLYLQSVNGRDSLTFRGDIGFYNYKNFRVNRITKASFALSQRTVTHAAVDLADEMYVSSYDTVDYNNNIFSLNTYGYLRYTDNTTALCDYAGNAINTSSITNWSFGDQSYISNTFEAIDVKLYNEKTVGLATGDGIEGEAERADMFVGPANELFAYVYLDQKLSAEESKKVYVEFNILDENEEYLKAYATSSSDYLINEVYGESVLTGTLLKFENIKISDKMRLDIAEGKESEPKIRIVGMFDDIDDKTAYINVVEPSNILYGDFTSPTVTTESFAIEVHEPDESDPAKYYKISIGFDLKDVENYSQISGLLGTSADIVIGGGVDKDTTVKFLISESSLPPQSKDDYTNELILRKNAMTKAGSVTVLNAESKYYLHLLIESDELYIDDLFVALDGEDISGNQTKIDPPDTIEYLVDEIAPKLHFSSQKKQAINDNTQIELTIGVSATDRNRIDRLLYYFDDGSAEEGAEPDWKVWEFEPGSDIYAEASWIYGGYGEDSDKIYTQTLWVKAIDEFGNECEPVAKTISLSLEKPSTHATLEGDINNVSNHHKITVVGPDASAFDGADAYTRVTVTPIDDPEYSYVTLVKTGETANILGFEGLTWYKVKLGLNNYTHVSSPEYVPAGYVLTEGSLMYSLFTYYGEIKISFENGYGDMTPEIGGYFYSKATAGSYFADPNFYTVRYASPYYTENVIHAVDFTEMIDREGVTVVSDGDKGNSPYKFNAARKNVNPMRNLQIHFDISNKAKGDFGLLDFDYESSLAELLRVGENGEEDVVVMTQRGLAASGSQYFTVKNYTDLGDSFITGAYYLRVTVKSNSGRTDVYESSRLVLDAQTADNAGIWQYSYQTKASISAVMSDSYSWETFLAEDEPFDSLGIAVSIGGEKMRSSVFAVYSYGVSGISVILSNPDSVAEYEGMTVGRVAGYKMWNLLSEPTKDEIEARGFEKNYSNTDKDNIYLSRINGTDDIFTPDTIPKGADGFSDLHLVKGINTICYQVKMENGYISPVKQFTIIVTDYTPELNIAIDNYVPSHKASQINGVVNAHSIRFFVETAYSLNGSGNVSVDLWSDYGMNIGSYKNGELTESFINDPSPQNQELGVLTTDMGVEDFADFTENSYTSDFPNYNSLCTAVFAATDEYGGVTIVAPQIGDHIRYGTNTGSSLDNQYNIDYYGTYFGDPYTVGDSFLSWRIAYNQAKLFGKELLGFENVLLENTEDREIVNSVLIESNPELQYNLFNISTNDISWGLSDQTVSSKSSYVSVLFQNMKNAELLHLDTATITFKGGDLGESITLPLSGGENSIGYMGASIHSILTFYVANPIATEENPVGTKVTRSFTISCTNIYGDKFETSGSVTLSYIDYEIKRIDMTESGAKLSFSFETVEYGSSLETGIFQDGEYRIMLTDLYGTPRIYSYTVDSSADKATKIELSTANDTAKPVTVTLSRSDGANIFVDINDYAVMSVENNGTPSVTVTVLESNRFSYRYIDEDGLEKMFFINVSNIKKPSPKLVWDYDENEVQTDEYGNKYLYGSVTVYLADPSFTLKDKYSDSIPSFTFEPGGESSYTFSASDISATLGDETAELLNDITASIDFTLYSVPDPIGKDSIDAETPNVQILAYSNLNGVYSDAKLALQLENARGSSALTDYKGYELFEFTGNRANASEMLERLGWSSSFRFVIETVDMSRTRIFIKEGLYADAPDYETGISDMIDGVTLNSKLLNVTKNAKFSLFVVDSENNYSSVAFEVSNLGNAPAPKIIKVQKSSELVRAYIIPPNDVTEFEILGADTVKTDLEAGSEYYGMLYIEYADNDEYLLTYGMIYNDVYVQDTVDISVNEIRIVEMTLLENGIVWSSNKAFEATNQEISVKAYLSDNISRLLCSEHDSSIVSFEVTGNILTVTYKDNHPAIEIDCFAENGSYVTVRLDEVANIDKSAPVISIVSRELAPNGKSLILTLATDERTVITNGGYAGEERDDGKYYYQRKITANGEYTFGFTDMSGLTAQISVEITELVLDELTALYSTSSDGSEAVSDPAVLQVKTGDTVYVNPLRDATAELSGGLTVQLKSGVWTAIAIPDSVGGICPFIIITDEYGNVLTHQFSKVKVPDTSSPDLIISKATVSVREGTDRAEVERELLANIVAFDNEPGEIKLSVRFTDDLSLIGVTDVEYSATDAAGNTTVKYGRLRITSIYEPVVYYGDKKLSRDDGLILPEGENITFNIDCAGLSYRALIKKGIKTASQMKSGITELTDYTLSSELDLGTLEKGIYTICIINQNRDYFRILISIE
ncbi:MAG: hypothetical protein J6A83_07190 [Clostridia bacterium]|nr:hypothetical protein [Clostridia bacterium]